MSNPTITRYYDIVQRVWVVAPGEKFVTQPVALIAGQDPSFAIQFCQGSTIVNLGTVSAYLFTIKQLNLFDAPALVSLTTCTATGSGTTSLYTFSATLDSAALVAALGSAPSLPCAIQIQTTVAGLTDITAALGVTLLNSYSANSSDPGAIVTGNETYVDAVNGVDATGVAGRFDLPFLTIAAAVSATISGQSIAIRPGSYNERNLLKTGVTQAYDPNAILTYSGANGNAVFDDSSAGTNGAVVTVIDGYRAALTGRTVNAQVAALARISNPASDVTLNFDTVSYVPTPAGSGDGATLWQDDGKLSAAIRDLSCGAALLPAIYWLNGEGRFSGDICTSAIVGTTGAIITALSTTATGECYIDYRIVKATAGIAFDLQDIDATARVWVRGDKFFGPLGAIQAGVSDGSAKWYFTGIAKMYATSTNTALAVVAQYSGNLWLIGCGKLTIPANASAIGIHLTSGSPVMYANFLEIECEGASDNIIKSDAAGAVGNITVTTHIGTSTSKGILVSAGTLVLTSSSIDTSANSSTVPLSGTSAATIILRNVVLTSGAAACITRSAGSGTVTVICEGACSANVPVGANVTVIGELEIRGLVTQFSTPIKTGAYTVATLPAIASMGGNARAFATDSTSTYADGLGNPVVGGGTNIVPVFTDGVNPWAIG